jgi:hypothetical protein
MATKFAVRVSVFFECETEVEAEEIADIYRAIGKTVAWHGYPGKGNTELLVRDGRGDERDEASKETN